MSQRPRILDILERATDPAADPSLAAGLPFVEPDVQCHIIDTLIDRAQEAGLEALVDYYDQLGTEAQSRLVGYSSRLFRTLRVAIRSRILQTRLNSLSIIRCSNNPRLAYLAAAGTLDGSHQIRAEAAVTLRELTEVHGCNHAETTALLRDATDGEEELRVPAAQTLRMLRDERQHLGSAVREALSHFESHHRPEVLEAAMYLADEMENELFQDDAQKRGKLTQPMMEIFGTSPSPQLAAFTYIALCYPEVRRRVVSVLASLRNPDFFAVFIRFHWLARDPRIKRNLGAIRSLAWLGDDFEAAFTLSAHDAALAPSWIVLLGLPINDKVKLLTSFLIIDNAAANRAAAWALAGLNTPSSRLALQGAREHDDPRIRQIADIALRTRGHDERAEHKPARLNRPPEWSALLDQAALSEHFEEFWQHFDRIPADLALAAGPHALKFVPGFQTLIQVRLVAQHAADRLRALKLLCDLNVADRFCKEVFAAANDSVPEVRAGAMKALGGLADLTSRRILERALADPSPVVQTAAIETLERISAPKRIELFLPKTLSPDAKVRAAAVQSLLKLHIPKAALALVSMLKDKRPDHRCAALWVVEQLHLGAVAARVAELAEHDPDPRIARIAQQVHRRLEKAARKSIADPPAARSTVPLIGGAGA